MAEKSFNINQLKLRQKEALIYALDVIRNSELAPYINDIVLFGSCAHHTERYESDVNLLLELNESFMKEKERLRIPLRLLTSAVMMDDLDAPEVDLRIVVGSEWRVTSINMYKKIKEEAVSLQT